MKLSDIITRVTGVVGGVSFKGEIEIKSICSDSRQVTLGALFFAISGNSFDGTKFIPEAISRGAVAIISEQPYPTSLVPVILVENSYFALGQIAEVFYGFPANKFDLIGVTGTNGKSSTVFLLEEILQEAKKKSGMIGTIVNKINRRELAANMTTPDAIQLQKLFVEMVAESVEVVTMEVSSHGLSQYRTGTIPYKFAIFTNLTQDHLDFHGDMDSYFSAKKRLFKELLHSEGKAIINADDIYGVKLLSELPREKVISVGLGSEVDCQICEIQKGREGWSFAILWKNSGKKLSISTSMIGEFNLYNVSFAVITALQYGISEEMVKSAVKNMRGVPGRLELFISPAGKRVFVDYAHTPDALQNVLQTLKPLGERIFCLFGCGGERDKGKRPLMAQVAEKYADKVWVTDDNPRGENSEQIRREILAGFSGKSQIIEMADRQKAIEDAIAMMGKDDLLVVAGKGHEDYQIYGKEKIQFSDREFVKKILEKNCA